MKPQTHTSPDGLLRLISEPTVTIDADHPVGFDDWIIALEPGPWHTHPRSLGDPEAFIAAILKDHTTLAIQKTNKAIRECSPVRDTDSEHWHNQEARMQPGDHLIYRNWSGKVFDEIIKRDIDELIDRCFALKNREDARTALGIIDDNSQGDRVIIAALKGSRGSIDMLYECAELANHDWRDLLVGAGFGHDIRAHQYWNPDW